ncbi:MAG: DUF4860 domain-containing protein [Lachnospiraceae bacterium]|jgi:hypothetical protein|nr:DUF4860 domain-containing protein [Lachnospiraceae bacterium]
MRREEQGKKAFMAGLISMVFLLGIFAVASLFLINIGVQVYKNVVIANNDNFELRTSLSYLATRVRQADQTGMVEIREEDGIKILVLGEENEDGEFETCLYFWDGFLYEHFMEKGGYFEPGYGMETFEVESLIMEQKASGQLYFRATGGGGDTEELYMTLRAGRGAD